MANVFIGVGHGGRDYGTCANGLKESEIALDIALEMNKILQQHGVNTMISRTTQGTDTLKLYLPLAKFRNQKTYSYKKSKNKINAV